MTAPVRTHSVRQMRTYDPTTRIQWPMLRCRGCGREWKVTGGSQADAARVLEQQPCGTPEATP